MELINCSTLFMDSNGGWLPDGENSYILFRKPVFSLSLNEQGLTVNLPDRVMTLNRVPLSVLEDYLAEEYIAVGYFSYEFFRFTEDGFIPKGRKEGELFPDMCFLFFKVGDMISGKIEDLKFHLQIPPLESFDSVEYKVEPAHLYSNIAEPEYIEMVRRVKDYIESGDVYQVNLSQQFTTSLNSSPLSYFLNLFHIQPVPFGCYINFGGVQLISDSMELFLRKTGDKLVTRPIKGTRKRGMTSEADALLKAELISSQKERAENLMIVDLMRNDLGRVCKYGTLKVNELFKIESYATLHQMVSEVEGYIKDEIKIKDIVKNTFPPGSVTGAPKRRALEIIDELEPHLRGPYCGAIGIFYPNGDFTLSVGIRILVAKGGIGTFWVGGGIVWDSDPEMEYQETLVKARAIKKALGMVE